MINFPDWYVRVTEFAAVGALIFFQALIGVAFLLAACLLLTALTQLLIKRMKRLYQVATVNYYLSLMSRHGAPIVRRKARRVAGQWSDKGADE